MLYSSIRSQVVRQGWARTNALCPPPQTLCLSGSHAPLGGLAKRGMCCRKGSRSGTAPGLNQGLQDRGWWFYFKIMYLSCPRSHLCKHQDVSEGSAQHQTLERHRLQWPHLHSPWVKRPEMVVIDSSPPSLCPSQVVPVVDMPFSALQKQTGTCVPLLCALRLYSPSFFPQRGHP